MFLDLLRLIRSGFRGDLPSRFILKKKLTGPGSDSTGEDISISFGPSSFYSGSFMIDLTTRAVIYMQRKWVDPQPVRKS